MNRTHDLERLATPPAIGDKLEADGVTLKEALALPDLAKELERLDWEIHDEKFGATGSDGWAGRIRFLYVYFHESGSSGPHHSPGARGS